MCGGDYQSAEDENGVGICCRCLDAIYLLKMLTRVEQTDTRHKLRDPIFQNILMIQSSESSSLLHCYSTLDMFQRHRANSTVS